MACLFSLIVANGGYFFVTACIIWHLIQIFLQNVEIECLNHFICMPQYLFCSALIVHRHCYNGKFVDAKNNIKQI